MARLVASLNALFQALFSHHYYKWLLADNGVALSMPYHTLLRLLLGMARSVASQGALLSSFIQVVAGGQSSIEYTLPALLWLQLLVASSVVRRSFSRTVVQVVADEQLGLSLTIPYHTLFYCCCWLWLGQLRG